MTALERMVLELEIIEEQIENTVNIYLSTEERLQLIDALRACIFKDEKTKQPVPSLDCMKGVIAREVDKIRTKREATNKQIEEQYSKPPLFNQEQEEPERPSITRN